MTSNHRRSNPRYECICTLPRETRCIYSAVLPSVTNIRGLLCTMLIWRAKFLFLSKLFLTDLVYICLRFDIFVWSEVLPVEMFSFECWIIWLHSVPYHINMYCKRHQRKHRQTFHWKIVCSHVCSDIGFQSTNEKSRPNHEYQNNGEKAGLSHLS